MESSALTVIAWGAGITALSVVLGYLFRWPWTGFAGYVDETGVYRPRYKTLWDWLVILLIPIVLMAGGFWFQKITGEAEQRASENRASIDRELSADNFRASTLQAYLSSMSDLLIKDDLLKAPEGSEVRVVARAMTRTVLRRLDSIGKASVIGFLSEAGLVNTSRTASPIIDLNEIDLTKTDLHDLNLNGVYLRGSYLSGADMVKIKLYGANISLVNLSEAKLVGADLGGAYLSGSNLIVADLSDSNLVGADLTGVDMRWANLSGASLSGVLYDENTTWPDGYTPPADAVFVK